MADDNHNGVTTAEVKSLVAEVKVLMVGSRQITLSVFRQLDEVDESDCEPMGRVNDDRSPDTIRCRWVIGRDKRTGALVKTDATYRWPRGVTLDTGEWFRIDEGDIDDHLEKRLDAHSACRAEQEEKHLRYMQLPLIVLAGLK